MVYSLGLTLDSRKGTFADCLEQMKLLHDYQILLCGSQTLLTGVSLDPMGCWLTIRAAILYIV